MKPTIHSGRLAEIVCLARVLWAMRRFVLALVALESNPTPDPK